MLCTNKRTNRKADIMYNYQRELKYLESAYYSQDWENKLVSWDLLYWVSAKDDYLNFNITNPSEATEVIDWLRYMVNLYITGDRKGCLVATPLEMKMFIEELEDLRNYFRNL